MDSTVVNNVTVYVFSSWSWFFASSITVLQLGYNTSQHLFSTVGTIYCKVISDSPVLNAYLQVYYLLINTRGQCAVKKR